MKLLAKSPEDRYTSADDVHTLFERCLAHVQQPTAVELPVELRSKAKSRKWVPALVVPVCIAIGCGVWWIKQRPLEFNGKVAVPQSENLLTESALQWEGDASEFESLQRDFAPVEMKAEKLWDMEPTKE